MSDADFEAWCDEARARDIAEVAEALGAKLRRAGHEMVGPCPVCGGNHDKLQVNPQKGVFLCRNGADGDVIALVRHALGLPDDGRGFVEACEWLTGRPPPGREATVLTEEEKAARQRQKDAREAKRKAEEAATAAADQKRALTDREKCERMFAKAAPFRGSPAEVYLRGRGIEIPGNFAFDLRFTSSLPYKGLEHPADETERVLGHFPAMLGAIRRGGDLIGLHRTYLDPETSEKLIPPGVPGGKAKKFYGRHMGGLIWLTAIAAHLVIAEGIETTLSAYLMGIGGDGAAYAAGASLGNIAGSATGSVPHPNPSAENPHATIRNGEPDDDAGIVLPDEVREITLIGDGDSDPAFTVASLLTGARRIARAGRDVFVVMAPRGQDLNDLLQEKGAEAGVDLQVRTLAEFEVYAGYVMAGWPDGKPVRPRSKFQTITIGEVSDISAKEHAWLINDLIPRHETSYLVGESGSGKSFLGLDMGLAIARGQEFFGNWTRRGGVLYVAGEGGIGAKKRLYGYKIHHQYTADDPFVMVPEKLNIYRKDGDTNDLIRVAKEWDRYWMALFGVHLEAIFIDTLAKSMDGADEISGKDMSLVMAAVDRIRLEVGCAVVLVHHLNASGGRERGHTSMRAGIETSIWITVDEHKVRTVTASKQKDGEGGDVFKFELMQVEVGTRAEDDKPITTCVVLPVGKKNELRAAEGRKPWRPTADQHAFLTALFAAIELHGHAAPPGLDPQPQGKAVAYEKVKIEFRDRNPSDGDAADEAALEKHRADLKNRLRRARTSLQSGRVIGVSSDLVYWAGKPVSGFPQTFPRPAEPPPERAPPPDTIPPSPGDGVVLPF